jgi:hypothetical protein
MVLGGVHGDPVQPGIKLRVSTETSNRTIGAHESVLGHVLALAPVVHVAADQRQDPVLVLAHQQVECGAVPALYALDQLEIQLDGWISVGHAGPHASGRGHEPHPVTATVGKSSPAAWWSCCEEIVAGK